MGKKGAKLDNGLSVLYDSEVTRVQLLSSSAKTNKTHDRMAPFYDLTGVVKVLIEIRKLVNILLLRIFTFHLMILEY